MLVLLTFLLLLAHTFFFTKSPNFLKRKSLKDWFLDGVNLTIQGTLIPFLVTILASSGYVYIIPGLKDSFEINPVFSFYLNFFIVDYLYYWNHRIFHRKTFFPLHIVHHTVTQMDVMATSRNTVWTSFLIIYLWVNSFFIYSLKDPAPFILAMSLSAALDMWKHSTFLISRPDILKFISKKLCIMTPQEHAWHHSTKININFGANLNIFDKLHGTYYYSDETPIKLGINTKLNYWRRLYWPF